MAFSCTVLSTTTVASAAAGMSFMLTAWLMVWASSSSQPSSPSKRRNLTRVVASQGRRGSKWAIPEKYWKLGESDQRSTKASSLKLKACLR